MHDRVKFRVWVHVRLAALDSAEMGELVPDAWRMVVPKGWPPRTTGFPEGRRRRPYDCDGGACSSPVRRSSSLGDTSGSRPAGL